MTGEEAAASPLPGDSPIAVGCRPERDDDETFLRALFRVSRPPGEDLAHLPPPLRDQILGHQFAGQRSTYRATYPDARFEIVECDGAAAGRIVTDPAADRILLVDIALFPAWRGRGVGTSLLHGLCGAARRAGVPVRLSVQAANTAAQRLYGRLGFRPVAASAVSVELEWTASV